MTFTSFPSRRAFRCRAGRERVEEDMTLESGRVRFLEIWLTFKEEFDKDRLESPATGS
jgi:hypothetical protein